MSSTTPPFTPDSELDLIFPPELISIEIKNQLPDDIHIRPLASTDYHRGHISVLAVLSHAPDPGAPAWTNHFYTMKSTVSATPAVASPVAPGGNDGLLHAPTPIAPGLAPRPSIQSNQIYFPIVIILKATDQVVATGNVFIEKKFLRGLGSVGHIEDIAVDKTQQGKKLGLRLIQTLTDISEALGCYKTILDCSDENTPFYEKCGFVRKGNEMAKYAPGERSKTPAPPRL